MQFNRERDVFLGWINFSEEPLINQNLNDGPKSKHSIDQRFILPTKSVMLERLERMHFLKKDGKIKDGTEVNLNYID